MAATIFYIVLGFLGLGFLIFIHELGHYIAARLVGMRVETFSIGFFKPIYQWHSKSGTHWKLCWLLFGGYVKIAGTESGEVKDSATGETVTVDPYSVPDGFFGKGPLSRIFVSLAGPAANILFALVAFILLWGMGGLTQNFSEHTHIIGWVDPHSELYVHGIRAGDEIVAYNGSAYNNSTDHLQAPMMSGDTITVSGYKVNYLTNDRTPFEYTVKTYPHPIYGVQGVKTAGILSPANYIIYEKHADGKENVLPPNSPMLHSGLRANDRIVWVDGELIFSSLQLNKILNDNRILVTVLRQDKPLLRRVPRVPIQELKVDQSIRNELTDWQYEAQLKGKKLQQIYMIPYNITNDATVEGPFKLIDEEQEKATFPQIVTMPIDEPLQEGDRIIAIDGQPIKQAYQILNLLQSRQVLMIVENAPGITKAISWEKADSQYDKEFNLEALNQIATAIGTGKSVTEARNYRLLKPIIPIARYDFMKQDKEFETIQTAIEKQEREISQIVDPDKRATAMKSLEATQKELVTGIPNVQDRKVLYNPGPIEKFNQIMRDIWHFLTALFTMTVSVKLMAGPIGILQSAQMAAVGGITHALQWLGFISLNLGIVNLLPIPVLDGGTILLSLYELITGHRMKPKTMERLILPFAIALIALFVFITFNDINRIFNIFQGFWS